MPKSANAITKILQDLASTYKDGVKKQLTDLKQAGKWFSSSLMMWGLHNLMSGICT